MVGLAHSTHTHTPPTHTGTVTLWSPNMHTSLVKLLCHQAPLTAVAIETGGWYMATAGMDAKLKIWDIRNYKLVNPTTINVPCSIIIVASTVQLFSRSILFTKELRAFCAFSFVCTQCNKMRTTTPTHTHTHTHRPACTHAHTHTHTPACLYTRTHAHTHTGLPVHMHTHTLTQGAARVSDVSSCSVFVSESTRTASSGTWACGGGVEGCAWGRG